MIPAIFGAITGMIIGMFATCDGCAAMACFREWGADIAEQISQLEAPLALQVAGDAVVSAAADDRSGPTGSG